MKWPNSRRLVAIWGFALIVAISLASSQLKFAIARLDGGVIESASHLGRPTIVPTSLPQARGGSLPRAVARIEGKGVTGSEVRLRGEASEGINLRYRWIQLSGPTVLLDDATRSEARFTVPDGIGSVAFLLVVTNPEGSDTTEVGLPINEANNSSDSTVLRADAGDDQIGLVGSQVTLNGSRSEPRGRVGFRWLQTGGPSVRLKIEESHFLSFVPTVPGVYRFALVVASGSNISQPGMVVVRVGSGMAANASKEEPEAVDSPKARPTVPTQEMARSGLEAIRGGAESALPLAQVFEDTADRMGMYHTYGDAFSEMSRRFEGILPNDPTRRQRWLDRVFQPLTTRTVEVMRAEGLELLRADAQNARLDDVQKAALAEQFRLIAEGFRSVVPPR